MELSKYKLKNNPTIHDGQPMNKHISDSINKFIESNFTIILKDLVDNQLMKELIEQTDYTQLLDLFSKSGNFQVGNPPFNNLNTFLTFIYF